MTIKKETKHLNFYRSMMQAVGDRPYFIGLCNSAANEEIDGEILDMVSPTGSDFDELSEEYYSTEWWGSGLPIPLSLLCGFSGGRKYTHYEGLFYPTDRYTRQCLSLTIMFYKN